MTVATTTHNAPPNVRWFYCRRLVVTQDGKTSVLWHDRMPGKRRNPEVRRIINFIGSDMRLDNHLFKLGDIPPERGDLVFLWDALAQPITQTTMLGTSKDVTLAELNRAAQWGGLRLSKRLVLRKGVKPTGRR